MYLCTNSKWEYFGKGKTGENNLTQKQNKSSDQYQNAYWSNTRDIDVDPSQITPFFQDFTGRLKQFGWTKVEYDGLVLSNQEKSCDETTFLERDFTHIESYSKKPWQFLILGLQVSNKGVQLSWDQKLDPKLGKALAGMMGSFLLVASILRLALPLGSIIPLLTFILGTLISLSAILIYMFKFEKSVNIHDDVAIAFIEAVMNITPEKLDKRGTPQISLCS